VNPDVDRVNWGVFAYIVRRILATIPVMVVVALFVFSLLHLSPGDPAAIIAGDTATLDDIARIRQKLGLDQPIYIQFVTWVWHLLHGDLGISIFTNLPVAKLIAQRVEPTVTLTISTLIISVSAAIPMGVVAAWKAGAWIDRLEGRMHINKVVVALANKIARIAWVVLNRPGTLYERIHPTFG